jgi:uncharacterized membrane protein
MHVPAMGNSTEAGSAPRYGLAAAVGCLALLAMDATWLALTTSRIYRPGIGHLMQPGFDLVPAALFYAVYFIAIGVFAVLPSRTTRGAWARGAFFGFVAYATYDLTNQATLRDWPWFVTFADLAWGTFVTSTCAALAHWVSRRRAY